MRPSVLVAATASPAAALYSAGSPVLQLNPNNFKSKVLNSNGVVLVEFFAPWCGQSKQLAPAWEKAAGVLKGVATVAALDADAHQALAQDVMEEKCASAAICFVSFLPDILDSKAEGRNKYLELLLSVAEKFKKSPYSFVWTAATKQPDLEIQVGVGGYGYPAMVALNVKKGAYAPLRSAFQHDEIIEFVKEAGRGAPTVVRSEPWDGKDGEEIVEDEFSLDELPSKR